MQVLEQMQMHLPMEWLKPAAAQRMTTTVQIGNAS